MRSRVERSVPPHKNGELAARRRGNGWWGASDECPPQSSVVLVGGCSGRELRGEQAEGASSGPRDPLGQGTRQAPCIGCCPHRAPLEVRLQGQWTSREWMSGITHTGPEGSWLPALP